jgi:hypothetical protein
MGARTLRLLPAVVVFVFSAGAAVVPAPDARAATAGERGYTLLLHPAAALWPTGMAVWVKPGKHTATDVTWARYAVQQLRRYGVAVRWGGVDATTHRHAITLTETAPSGCHGEDGYGGQYAAERNGGPWYVDHAFVRVCPGTYRYTRRSWTENLYLHEFGHAVGLGHVYAPYRGHLQVMRPNSADGVTRYQAGDINGLHKIVALTRALRSAHALVAPVPR